MRDHGGPLKSETADIDGARALTAAGLDDSLATIERRTAVVAMMDGVVTLVTALRRCLGFRSIANDDGLARHDGFPLLPTCAVLPTFWLISRLHDAARSRHIAAIVFPECFVAIRTADFLGDRHVGAGCRQTSLRVSR